MGLDQTIDVDEEEINKNKSCIEIAMAFTIEKGAELINKNKSCIEKCLRFLGRQEQLSINKNKSCIEIPFFVLPRNASYKDK